jgi:GT2 family glycosyltransferase
MRFGGGGRYMRERLRQATKLQIGGRRKPAMLFGLAFLISLAVIFESPDLSTFMISTLASLLKHLEIYVRLDHLVIRCREELVQNLSGLFLQKSDWSSLEIEPHSIPIGSRVKYVFMVSVVDISVIVPTWNEEKYLPSCLRSLANQSHRQPSEIIVVDGGSTDQTISIAEKYADKVLVQKGQPVGAARNKGAEAAKGDVLAFIDADTMASGHWLEEIAHSFSSNRGAVGVTGPTLPYEGTKLDDLVYHVATGWAQRFSLKLGFPHVAGFNCAYRKGAFWDAGGFDENRELSEDVMLSLRIRHQGQIAFNHRMVAYTSLRRIKRHGYPYLTTYYAMNAITMLVSGRNLAYPKIR